MQKKYMPDKNSFMPISAIMCVISGGIFVGAIRNWVWGALSIPSGVLLILAAAATAVFIWLAMSRRISGLLMLIPASLTAFAFLLNVINMLLIKGNFAQRVELLIFILFVAMLLIIIASLTGRRGFDRKKTLFICVAVGAVALFSCFIPLFIATADKRFETFMELLQTSLPLIFYFAAYICYFAGIEKSKEVAAKEGE